ncbi:MAG: DEAD/DEAH box helicase, partial [Patescibacteria group bacterium]|nr:DEAD/DEAH box helicase [Patescibacteria group bacterium]
YNEHNLFRLAYLAGHNVYENYDKEVVPIDSEYPLRLHQVDMASQWLTYRHMIWAAEMGLGKSLAVIAVLKKLSHLITPDNPPIWASTKSALTSVRLECDLWNYHLPIKFLTYEGVKKYIENIKSGTKAPRILIGDESHKLKNGTTQRTQAFAYITQCMREEYGEDCYIILMTGTPAPKSPIDWYSQCEIVRPGFLKEGNVNIFKDRLAIIAQKESGTGGIYPELVSWRDDSKKCGVCGKLENDYGHDVELLDNHAYVPSVNEVELLYARMKGLVLVKTKADCLDLPEKIYKRIYCKPKETTLRAMKMIAKVQPSTIKVLTLCRELSDGFQYIQEERGKKTCELCNGSGKVVAPNYIGPPKTQEFINTLGIVDLLGMVLDSPEDYIIDPVQFPQYFEDAIVECCHCNGSGEVANIIQSYRETFTAKDEALQDIIDDHEDIGRLVIYAGFTASVDRVIDIVVDKGWDYIRVDGRGWKSSLSGDEKVNPEKLIRTFQNKNFEKQIVFIGNPGSAGTGLTLTASPTICYYSNDFNADSRQQSEDRIHRMGMDQNRGATIIDLIHLPTDEYVLDNLLRKKRLQDLSLGQITEAMEMAMAREDYV